MKHSGAAGWRLLALVMVVMLAGCATHKINWASRVGSYTHDQAILELGPPDKQATLTDDTVVAEWLTRGATLYSSGAGYYGYPGWAGYYGGFYPPYVQTTPNYFLRLTFGPDGRLTAWKQYAR